jgi:hypothetical protein
VPKKQGSPIFTKRGFRINKIDFCVLWRLLIYRIRAIAGIGGVAASASSLCSNKPNWGGGGGGVFLRIVNKIDFLRLLARGILAGIWLALPCSLSAAPLAADPKAHVVEALPD